VLDPRVCRSRFRNKTSPIFGLEIVPCVAYTLVNGRPLAQADIQRFFRVIPPSVHQMLLTLEREGLISRRPGVARSIAVLLDRADLPELQPGYGQPVKTTVQNYWPDTMSRRNRIPHSR